jgi:hypothetical protein
MGSRVVIACIDEHGNPADVIAVTDERGARYFYIDGKGEAWLLTKQPDGSFCDVMGSSLLRPLSQAN